MVSPLCGPCGDGELVLASLGLHVRAESQQQRLLLVCSVNLPSSVARSHCEVGCHREQRSWLLLLPSGLQSQPGVCSLSLLGMAWLLSCSCRHSNVTLPGRSFHLSVGPAPKGARSCLRSWVGSVEGTWMGLETLSLLIRVEKKERARLKTVKFHARTGMIESNRVSADLGLSGAPGTGN